MYSAIQSPFLLIGKSLTIRLCAARQNNLSKFFCSYIIVIKEMDHEYYYVSLEEFFWHFWGGHFLDVWDVSNIDTVCTPLKFLLPIHKIHFEKRQVKQTEYTCIRKILWMYSVSRWVSLQRLAVAALPLYCIWIHQERVTSFAPT